MSHLDAKEKRFVSLHTKIWLIFFFVILPAMSITYILLYRMATNTALGIITKNLSRVIDGALVDVDGDGIRQLYEQEIATNPNCPPKPGSEINGYYPDDNPLYRAHMAWIENILRYNPNMSIYTYMKGPNKGDVLAIGSSWYFREPRQGFKFCELYNSQGLSRIADGLDHRVDVWSVYTDSYGSWITTYAPIHDSAGNIVGAIGVDVPANEVTEIQGALKKFFWVLFFFVLLGMVYATYLLTMTVTRPVTMLSSIAQRIGLDELDGGFSYHRIGVIWRDEVDLLAQSMERMAISLWRHKQKLIESGEKMEELARLTIKSQETERRYYARELHDHAGQLLFSLKMKIQSVMTDIEEEQILNNEMAVKRLQQAMDEISTTLEIVRQISHKMRPTLLDLGDINLAFDGYCSEFSQVAQIDVEYVSDVDVSLHEDAAISLFRFLQETLSNVQMHARFADKVKVNLLEANGMLSMSIYDNGKSDGTFSMQLGIGLTGVRERFLLLGGEVLTEVPAEGGFRVTARMPLAINSKEIS